MRCRKLLLLVLTLATIPTISESAKILGVFPLNGRSHFVMFESLMRGLAARGHDVHVISHFPQKKPLPNYTDISLQGTLPNLVNGFTVKFAREFHDLNVLDFIWNNCMDMCKTLVEHPEVQSLLKSDQTFDLIVTELLGPDCFIALSHRYQAPFINMISSVAFPWANDRIGNPDNPAYIPNYFVPYTHNMTFPQRLINAVTTELLKIGHYIFADVPAEKFSRKYFGDVPSISELQKDTSLILVNSHFSINNPRPTVPAFVEVGGIHIQSNGKLPMEIETFLREAEDGAIFFTLGSLVRCETLPEDKLRTFINVFSKLPKRVVWKIDHIEGLPKNVIASKWLPQFDILSHPNVELFITHGGLMGLQEGVHAGVPMVGIPLFADQELNLRNAVSRGIGVMLDFDSVTEETLSEAINTVLNDPSYHKNAKRLSTIFRDRPQSALETAIFWSEYVIRHKGARHLRSAAVDLAWYQYLLLDVVAVVLLFIALLCVVTYYIIVRLYNLCFRKRTKLKKQ